MHEGNSKFPMTTLAVLKFESSAKAKYRQNFPVREGKRNICHGTNSYTEVGGYGNECRSTPGQQRKSAA